MSPAGGRHYIAIDIGAESGRVIVGVVGDDGVALDEVHRFPNTPVRTPDGLHWDILRLYGEALIGIRAATARYGRATAGIGVDSWAVDYGLLDARGRLLGNPYHYRDHRTDGVREEAARVVPAAELYARTGIAQLPFNTLYQLMAQRRDADATLDEAASLLMIPDLLHYWLTGETAAEQTNASTTGALGIDGDWATDLLRRLDVPERFFLNPTPPATVLGPLRAGVCDECGLEATARVVLPASHDTASAVVAVPAAPTGRGGATHAYISSGTWSLLGIELARPVASDEARQAGFTNERGASGTYRFLTNIMGLWIVQECRRAWARHGQDWSYEELTARAAAVASDHISIDVDDPSLLHPDDMPAALQAQLRAGGQAPVDDPVVLVRAVLEGLARSYRRGVESIERLAGVSIETIHIVGGGARNALLCQLTADACRRPVVAGPAEATALGNVLVQAIGAGQLRDLRQARALSRLASGIRTYHPRP